LENNELHLLNPDESWDLIFKIYFIIAKNSVKILTHIFVVIFIFTTNQKLTLKETNFHE